MIIKILYTENIAIKVHEHLWLIQYQNGYIILRKGVFDLKKVSKLLTMFFAITFIIIGNSLNVFAEETYVSLDSENPIEFKGDTIVYKGEEIKLGEKAFFIDGSLDEKTAEKYPYVFTSINEATTHLTDGTESEPMKLYIAPYVYWVDNPQDEEVRKPDTLSVPYGLIIDCEWLSFIGLTDDPYNVVIAANRGQSHGAEGNFTNLYIKGDGLRMKNLTVGNYCNVDLEFPLKPELNYPKRTETITQGQLVHSDGDKIIAENCNFISRLNANPIISDKRVLLYKCHVESTDDALNGSTVHIDCTFDFYGNRPAYSTRGTGSVFINCEFNSKIYGIEADPNQYITKEGGPVAIINSEFKSDYSVPVKISWTKYPKDSLRCYQYNVLHNGESILLSEDNPWVTVDMTDKAVLDAYLIEYEGEQIPNTYNLLRGNDEWDPMGVKEIALKAEKTANTNYTNVPTLLSIESTADQIESEKTEATLRYKVDRFGNFETSLKDITWSIDEKDKDVAELVINKDGTCILKGINDYDESRKVIVYANSSIGLEAAYAIEVLPSTLPAPTFDKAPEFNIQTEGKVVVDYSLDLGSRADLSKITWYRSKNQDGSDAIEVAVSNLERPQLIYELTLGDIGYYLIAKIEPKNIRSNYGEAVTIITENKISKEDVKNYNIHTDFENFSTKYNSAIKEGFWTVDSYKPLDTSDYEWTPDSKTAWTYGKAIDGAKGTGLYQTTQGARLMYTPVNGEYGDMTVTVNLDPSKTQGQGFGSAKAQYLDVYIKFDTKTLTGYALRIERTSKSSRAVDFSLVEYNNGVTTHICEPITSSAYLTDCTITLNVVDDKLIANVKTSSTQLPEQKADKLPHEVNLVATITPNNFGGAGVQHTGTTGSSGVGNITMLHEMSIDWANIEDIVAKDDTILKISFNGKSEEVEVILKNKSLYIPTRKFAENVLGGQVDWNEKNKTVTVKFNDSELVFSQNSNKYNINGQEKIMSNNMFVFNENDTVYTTVGFICDALSLNYSLDEKTNSIVITK